MQKPSVIVKDLVAKMQGITVLDGISFSLLPHQHLAIAGNAGSGKTTLANALAGRVHCSGTINFVSNTDFSISLVEQRYSFKNLSGINNFYYQQRFNSFDGSDAPTVMEDLSESISHKATHNCAISVDEILNALGIEHLKNAPLIQLSSGEHKRFQLAKALLNPPAILILDSPYTGLDVMIVKQLNELLNQISKNGTQIILIAGTFPIPGFITHIGHIEQKKFIFFGKKGNYQAGKFASVAHSAAIKNHWVPVSKEDFAKGTVVEMKNVRIQYGHHVILNHLDWKIEQGEKWLLKGRNGAGKSSLLNLITADHPQAYSNEIYLFGKRRGSGESIWDIKKNIGYISPELHAYFDKAISCFEAIASGYFDTTGLYKKLSNTQCDYIKQWLDFLQLSHVQNKPLHCISTGLQRMVLLARALVKNPPLLILDEPCQGLDNQQSARFVLLIDEIYSGSNKTLIYVSHDETSIPSCIERILELQKETPVIQTIGSATLAAAS